RLAVTSNSWTCGSAADAGCWALTPMGNNAADVQPISEQLNSTRLVEILDVLFVMRITPFTLSPEHKK
ncbi:MAG: hypothetical protein Q8M35_04790, partial [Pseudohongiella sp.]|nr:hypothetical protein [Pseudohongiella sp.]